MTSRAEPRLPDCIQADWADFLDGLPSPWQRWGWELIQIYLPPLCVDALAILDVRHTADGGGPRPGEQPWDDLLTPDGVTLTQAVPGRIWMSHPLYMAIYGLFHGDRPGHLQARNLLVRYLADLDAPEDTHESQAYYDDALALRRCLQTLARANWLAELPNHPDLGDLLQALDGLPEQALKERGLPDKIQTVRALTAGKRYLGTRQFHQANRRTTTRLPRRHLTRATPGSQSHRSRRSPSVTAETGTYSSAMFIAIPGRLRPKT